MYAFLFQNTVLLSCRLLTVFLSQTSTSLPNMGLSNLSKKTQITIVIFFLYHHPKYDNLHRTRLLFNFSPLFWNFFLFILFDFFTLSFGYCCHFFSFILHVSKCCQDFSVLNNYINTNSRSSFECLIENALAYSD